MGLCRRRRRHYNVERARRLLLLLLSILYIFPPIYNVRRDQSAKKGINALLQNVDKINNHFVFAAALLSRPKPRERRRALLYKLVEAVKKNKLLTHPSWTRNNKLLTLSATGRGVWCTEITFEWRNMSGTNFFTSIGWFLFAERTQKHKIV